MSNEKPKPRRLSRAWLTQKWKDSQDALRNVWLAFNLVWQAHHRATAIMAALTLVGALIPTTQAIVGKLIVDAVVNSINRQGLIAEEGLRAVLPYLLIEFALIMASAAISQARSLAEHVLHARSAPSELSRICAYRVRQRQGSETVQARRAAA